MKKVPFLTHTSVDDCRSAVAFASREDLIAAHRWCEANSPGQKTRRGVLAAALRRLERNTPKP